MDWFNHITNSESAVFYLHVYRHIGGGTAHNTDCNSIKVPILALAEELIDPEDSLSGTTDMAWIDYSLINLNLGPISLRTQVQGVNYRG